MNDEGMARRGINREENPGTGFKEREAPRKGDFALKPVKMRESDGDRTHYLQGHNLAL